MRRRSGPTSTFEEHRVLTFVAVAAIVLGSLVVAARLVSGAEPNGEASFADAVATAEPIDAQAALPSAEAVAPPPVEAEEPNHNDTPAIDPTATPTQAATVEAVAPTEEAPIVPIETATAVPATSTPTPPPTATPIPPPPPPSSPPPAVAAKSFAVVERECGALIWGKNEHERLAPASITKIVTAMVTRENARLDEMVDVHVSGSDMARKGSSVMGIEPGMTLSVQDLLYGLLLPSGNDAALALADEIGGDTERFVQMMNDEAARLGMTDTHFANPHGLDNREHYSSALDMAKAGIAALTDPVIARISVTPTYQPAWTGPALKNGNKLLDMYPGAFGLKIGYTTNAQQTFVAAAKRNGREVVVSVLGTADRYSDAITLLDWAFAKAPDQCPGR